MTSQNLFLYGPLADPELLAVVLRRAVGPDELLAARAMRRAIRASANGDAPTLAQADGEAAAGVLLRNAAKDVWERSRRSPSFRHRLRLLRFGRPRTGETRAAPMTSSSRKTG